MINRCYKTTIAVAIAATLMIGCDKLTPNGQSTTMSLLKAGSDKVCVASDVQRTLRSLILPKLDDTADVEYRKTVADFAVAFDLTTLQSADKTVDKAVCNTTAKMSGLATGERSFQITYQISPAAERSGDFVVSGDMDAARVFARDEIGNIVAHQLAAQAQEQQAAQDEQSRQKLLTMITPRWLIGSWIQASSNSALCSDGHAMVYRPGHGFSAFQATGQWTLSADTLHVVGQNAAGPMDLEGTITAADPLSFTLAGKDGQPVSFRRCSPEEITGPALPDVIAPADPAQN